MADFSKFKIGNTSYNVKDAKAARDIEALGAPGNRQGLIQLTDASSTPIGTGITLDINDNISLDHMYVDSTTLADGDVLTWDANGQSWQNKPASGGGSAKPVIVLANAVRWPLQSSNDLLHPINQGLPATLLAIRNEYEGSIVPVSAYTIAIDRGGYYSNYSDLISLAQYEPVGTHFDLTVWLVEGLQSNQMHKITFAGIVDTSNTITLQGVSSFAQASIIGA